MFFFTGFYNLVHEKTIIHTDYFLFDEDKDEKYVVKKILKKYKKMLKQNYIDNIKIDIFHIEYYNETENDVKEILNIQLNDLTYTNNNEIVKSFDFTDLKNILDLL